jgi:hypothetical protein
MKNLTTSAENDYQIISVIIPSLNGVYAKLLILTKEDYSNLKRASESNTGKVKLLRFYVDSRFTSQILGTASGLNRIQFDELLQRKYNLAMGFGKNGAELKLVA